MIKKIIMKLFFQKAMARIRANKAIEEVKI
jgi:hypothetical protein